MISALDALDKLREGNIRFASGNRIRGSHSQQEFRRELLARQSPFAIVLGCSDSRVPAEIVFDQGLGDLFVIRVAGNIVGPTQIGSVEFAVRRLGARLVVVLGHSRCGAIEATIEEVQHPREGQSRGLDAIVSRIRPAVEAAMAEIASDDPEKITELAIRKNINTSVYRLQHESEVLVKLIQSDRLLVTGAQYSLESRLVEFFYGAPD